MKLFSLLMELKIKKSHSGFAMKSEYVDSSRFDSHFPTFPKKKNHNALN